MVGVKQAELFCDLLRQVTVHFPGYTYCTISYASDVMKALQALKQNGCDASTLADTNNIVTDACKRALRGAGTSLDDSRQGVTVSEAIPIMEEDFQALVN